MGGGDLKLSFAMACSEVVHLTYNELFKIRKRNKTPLNSPPLSGNERHRVSCHRCGNIRLNKVYCHRCVMIYWCADKMADEHGHDIFESGCPVCKKVCCCVEKSKSCQRKYHCYKKCPCSKAPKKRDIALRQIIESSDGTLCTKENTITNLASSKPHIPTAVSPFDFPPHIAENSLGIFLKSQEKFVKQQKKGKAMVEQSSALCKRKRVSQSSNSEEEPRNSCDSFNSLNNVEDTTKLSNESKVSHASTVSPTTEGSARSGLSVSGSSTTISSSDSMNVISYFEGLMASEAASAAHVTSRISWTNIDNSVSESLVFSNFHCCDSDQSQFSLSLAHKAISLPCDTLSLQHVFSLTSCDSTPTIAAEQSQDGKEVMSSLSLTSGGIVTV